MTSVELSAVENQLSDVGDIRHDGTILGVLLPVACRPTLPRRAKPHDAGGGGRDTTLTSETVLLEAGRPAERAPWRRAANKLAFMN